MSALGQAIVKVMKTQPPAALVLLGVVLTLSYPSVLKAQGFPGHSAGGAAAAHSGSPGVDDDEVDHGHFRNEFMLFVGDTRKGGQNEFTVGFDYLRSLGEHWGVGIFLDYARGTFEREYIAGLGAFWAPFSFAPDLHLLVGAGWERLDENTPHHHAHEHHEPHTDADFAGDWHHDDLWLARFGGSYLLHFGRGGEFVLAPQAFYDVVQGRGRDAVVFGIGIGYLF